MNNNILLTYVHIDGYDTYKWFENVKSVDEFIKSTDKVHEILECIDCTNAVNIPLNELGNI